MNHRDRIISSYASNNPHLQAYLDEKACLTWGLAYRNRLKGWLPGSADARILDVGCGAGRMLCNLLTWGYSNLEGIDLSPEQVERCCRVMPGARIHQGDALGFMESKPAEYDLIIAMDVIEHLSKPECIRFLDAARIALRPGGRLVIQTLNAENPMAMSIRYGDFTHENAFTPGVLDWLTRIAGFEAFEAREQRPVAHGLMSAIRLLLWQLLRQGIRIWNLVEMGSVGSGVHTRNQLVSVRKPLA